MVRNVKLRASALLLIISLVFSLLCGCRQIISLDEIPEYSGKAYVEINGGVPFFEEEEITDEAFESYSPLDALGRCGVAFACIGIEIMPTEERGEIASVTPSGWEYNGISNNNQYEFVENNYVYNRCHLIGHQLAGENDNDRNLITGTRYMNIEGMLDFENEVAEYVKSTENHVMYRVTPIFNGYDYVAQGVLMEAYSVEDDGSGVCFCIFAYNVQPGVTIDYFTGVNVANGENLPEINTDGDNREEIAGGNKTDDSGNGDKDTDVKDEANSSGGENCNYILNTNSKKFHTPGTSCANSIKDKNREEYIGTREQLIEKGYDPCGICKP